MQVDSITMASPGETVAAGEEGMDAVSSPQRPSVASVVAEDETVAPVPARAGDASVTDPLALAEVQKASSPRVQDETVA